MINTNINSPDFNSYASEDELAAFADLRGIELPDKTVPLLIRAMDYLEGMNWAGRRVNLAQPLAWPRKEVYIEDHELPHDQIPRQVITAQCMLAVEAIDGELLGSVREAAVKTERVDGAVTMTYAVADGETFTPSYPAVTSLLDGLAIARGFAINTFAERA